MYVTTVRLSPVKFVDPHFLQLRHAIEARVREGAEAIDMIHWMGRTALELIGQGALGHSFDSLIEDSNDEYTEAVKAFM